MTIIAFDSGSDDRRREAAVGRALNAWADEGSLDHLRSAKLAALVKRRARRERMSRGMVKGLAGLVAAAACAAVLVVTSPAVRTWATDNLPPVVGQYLERWYPHEKGWEWAAQHQMFQDVMAVNSDHGYTFRVHRVLSDPTQTVVIYTVDGPDLGADSGLVILSARETKFDGQTFLSSWSSRSEIIDGVRVGSLRLGPLPAQAGHLVLAVRSLDGRSGSWDVGFDVTRELLEDLSVTHEVGQSIAIPGGTVTISRMSLTPLQTILVLEYEGQSPPPQLGTNWPVTLTTSGGTVLEGRGGSARSHTDSRGWVKAEYIVEFDPLYTTITHVEVGFGHYEFVRVGDGLSLSITGETLALAGGWEVSVADFQEDTGGAGQATLAYANHGSPYDRVLVDWAVLDRAGEHHPTTAGTGPSGHNDARGDDTGAPREQPSLTDTLSWVLPDGRAVAGFAAKGYWVPAAKAPTITVDLPPIGW